MKRNPDRRIILKSLGAGLAASALTPFAISRSYAQEWPTGPVTMVVPFAVGGSVDVFARAMQPYIERELGQPVVIENKPGASTLVGHTYFLGQPDDGNTILCTAASIYMAMNIIIQDATFSIDDFAFINLPQTTSSVFSAGAQTPYKTMKDFVDAVKANPGSISVGTVPGSAHDLNMLLLFDSIGLSKDDVRIVTYTGGGAMQTAIGGGVIDATAHAAESSVAMREYFQPLVVFDDQPTYPFLEAPLVDEVVREFGGTPKWVQGSINGFVTHASLPEKHPDRWERLVTAFKNIAEDEQARKELEEKLVNSEWIGPERSKQLVVDSFEVIREYEHLLQRE